MIFTIEQGSLDDVLAICRALPEFDKPLTIATLEDKIRHCPAPLILIAKANQQLAGFKLGYSLSESKFYSWLGGVLPQYRRQRLAQALMDAQECYLIKQNFKSIHVKSMNKYRGMMTMLIANNYDIVGYEDNGTANTSKILFSKHL